MTRKQREQVLTQLLDQLKAAHQLSRQIDCPLLTYFIEMSFIEAGDQLQAPCSNAKRA